MNKLYEFLMQSGLEILETLSIVSYDMLAVAGLIALVLYIFGWKKGMSIGFMCPAIYMIVQILTKCLVK